MWWTDWFSLRTIPLTRPTFRIRFSATFLWPDVSEFLTPLPLEMISKIYRKTFISVNSSFRKPSQTRKMKRRIPPSSTLVYKWSFSEKLSVSRHRWPSDTISSGCFPPFPLCELVNISSFTPGNRINVSLAVDDFAVVDARRTVWKPKPCPRHVFPITVLFKNSYKRAK